MVEAVPTIVADGRGVRVDIMLQQPRSTVLYAGLAAGRCSGAADDPAVQRPGRRGNAVVAQT